MAYGNWGARVYKDTKRMYQWEDQTPYKESEIASGYIQAFLRNGPLKLNPYHAVLGEKRIRLCGYKNTPVLFIDGKLVEIGTYVVTHNKNERNTWRGALILTGESKPYMFEAIQFDNNTISLDLTEPDGTVWNAICGYEYGDDFK